MPKVPERGRAVSNRFLAALAYGDYQTLWTANFFAGRGGVGADSGARLGGV